MKLYLKKIFMIVVVFLILVATQIAADEIVFARNIWAFIGLIFLISWIVKLLNKILKTFFKDLEDYLMK